MRPLLKQVLTRQERFDLADQIHGGGGMNPSPEWDEVVTLTKEGKELTEQLEERVVLTKAGRAALEEAK